MSQITESEERGMTYPALTVVGEEYDFIDQKLREQLQERTLGIGALPVVFPISATSILNSQIAVAFRSSLQKRLWHFLIPDGEADEFLVRNNKEYTFDATDAETTALFLQPYVQTGLFINECVNLDMSLVNGVIKLTEKAQNHKDRYSSVSYANWIISNFDKTLLRDTEEDNTSDWDILSALTQIC